MLCHFFYILISTTLLRTTAAADATATSTSLKSFNFGTDAVTESTNNDFLDWYTAVGGLASGVTVGHDGRYGRGVYATQSIAEDDEVISVPLEWCMSRISAMKDDSRTAKAAYRQIQSDDDLVALMLMREMSKGYSKSREKKARQAAADKQGIAVLDLQVTEEIPGISKWAPYLRVLPRTVPLTIFYNQNELNALEDSTLSNEANQRRSQMSKQFKSMSKQIKLLFKDLPIRSRKSKFADYLWAKSVVGSRALSMSGKKFLVPLADMFNYHPHQVERDADNGANFLRYHKMHDGRFHVYADRAATSQKQLMEDYGDNTNELYINHHGMVVDDNPFDCVKVQLPTLSTHAKSNLGLRTKIFNKLGLTRLKRRPLCLVPKRPLSPLVNMYLLVLAANKNDLVQCDAAMATKTAAGESLQVVAEACEKAMAETVTQRLGLQLMSNVIKKQLHRYKTTLADDVVLLDTSKKEHLKSKQKKDKGNNKKKKKRGLAAQLGLGSDDVSSLAMTVHETLAVRYRMTRKKILSLLLVDMASRSDGSTLSSTDESAARHLQDVHVTWEDVPEDGALEDKVKAFNAWFAAQKPRVNKLIAAAVPMMRIGTLTTSKVDMDEIYLEVPVKACMSSSSAWKDDVVGPVLKELRVKHPRGDAFHELLFHLIYERFVRGRQSKWWPYLNLIPSIPEINAPGINWTEEELNELEGSDILQQLLDYSKQVDRKFKGVAKHVLALYPEIFLKEAYTREHYRWAHAILDSRRIWWNGEGSLVPMLDLVNCAEGPDSTRVHSTWLDEETQSYAVTKGAWNFKKGEQLFEPYGQPNHIYFAYHGFLLDHNAHDCVNFKFQIPKSHSKYSELMNQLQKKGIRRTTYCISIQKISLELLEFIKIVHNGGNDRASQRTRLAQLCQERLTLYPTSIEEDQLLLDKGGNSNYKITTAIKFRLSEKLLLNEIVVKYGGEGKKEL